MTDCIRNLTDAGIKLDDAKALRRISMTLHRWHELECGDGNDYGSWCITRGRKEVRHGQYANGHGAHYVFIHDEDGKPFLEHHHYLHGKGKDFVSYEKLPDRERGALERLGKIMARYRGYVAHVQTDPRGCALYIIPRDRIRSDEQVCAEWLSCNYTRGIAVYK